MDFKTTAPLMRVFGIALLMLFTACNSKNKVDLIVHNGSIYTVDDAFSMVEAMAIKNGKIVETGPEHQILNKYTATEYQDCQKRFVYPGFIDAHCHFMAYGLMHDDVNLFGTSSLEEIITILQQHPKPDSGEWIFGRGWDQNDWEESQYPTKEVLDKIFPNNPVVLKRIDGHAYWVNSQALQIGEISSHTEVLGGMIVADDNGPTGILIDNACDLIQQKIPIPTIQELNDALNLAQKDCINFGITSVADAGLNTYELNFLKEKNEKNELKMHIYAMISSTDSLLDDWLTKGPYQKGKLSIRSIKLYADGALGSRGAMLLESYHDKSEHLGLNFIGRDSVIRLGEKVLANDFQLNTHAIGDSANRLILHGYGEVLQGTNDKRWRIEHAQVVHPTDIALFKQYNIIPSVQPTHATSDMPWVTNRLGTERVKTAYAYKNLLEQNGLLALGTDFPVEKISPLATFRSATARVGEENENEFQTENAINREQALRGMTIWAAIANFQDSLIGSLEVGKSADFVIMRKDLMTHDVTNLSQEDIIATYINGENKITSQE